MTSSKLQILPAGAGHSAGDSFRSGRGSLSEKSYCRASHSGRGAPVLGRSNAGRSDGVEKSRAFVG